MPLKTQQMQPQPIQLQQLPPQHQISAPPTEVKNKILKRRVGRPTKKREEMASHNLHAAKYRDRVKKKKEELKKSFDEKKYKNAMLKQKLKRNQKNIDKLRFLLNTF